MKNIALIGSLSASVVWLFSFAVNESLAEQLEHKRKSNSADNRADSITEPKKVLGKKALAKRKKIETGKFLYKLHGCSDCHSLPLSGAKKRSDGNDTPKVELIRLDFVALKRSRKFIERHLLDPERHVEKNPKAFDHAPNMMPNFNLQKKEVDAIIEYLNSKTGKVPQKNR